jgi:hypothetical protein
MRLSLRAGLSAVSAIFPAAGCQIGCQRARQSPLLFLLQMAKTSKATVPRLPLSRSSQFNQAYSRLDPAATMRRVVPSAGESMRHATRPFSLFLFCLLTVANSACKQAHAPNASPRRAESDDPLFVVSRNGKFGFIDGQGKLVIPLQFDAVDLPILDGPAFSEGVTAVCIGKCDWVPGSCNDYLPV